VNTANSNSRAVQEDNVHVAREKFGTQKGMSTLPYHLTTSLASLVYSTFSLSNPLALCSLISFTLLSSLLPSLLTLSVIYPNFWDLHATVLHDLSPAIIYVSTMT
jgi:hypothetical protein